MVNQTFPAPNGAEKAAPGYTGAISAKGLPPLLLASQSPRRQDILRSLGIPFTVLVSDADETVPPMPPAAMVEAIARKKLEAVRNRPEAAGALILACDTVVNCDGTVFGKPAGYDEAVRMLRTMSGRTHEVCTGMAIALGDTVITAHEITEVSFFPLSDREIEAYIRREPPYDKAGAYGIQESAALFVEGIRGDYLNIVGMPVARLSRLIDRHFGFSLADYMEAPSPQGDMAGFIGTDIPEKTADGVHRQGDQT